MSWVHKLKIRAQHPSSWPNVGKMHLDFSYTTTSVVTDVTGEGGVLNATHSHSPGTATDADRS